MCWIGFSAVVLAEETSTFSPPMEITPSMYNSRRKPVTQEQSIEELEAYFLETVFLKDLSGANQSLLTDEEKEDSPMSVQSDTQDQMLMKALSAKLAKQDILGLKKQLLKKKTALKPQPLSAVRR